MCVCACVPPSCRARWSVPPRGLSFLLSFPLFSAPSASCLDSGSPPPQSKQTPHTCLLSSCIAQGGGWAGGQGWQQPISRGGQAAGRPLIARDWGGGPRSAGPIHVRRVGAHSTASHPRGTRHSLMHTQRTFMHTQHTLTHTQHKRTLGTRSQAACGKGHAAGARGLSLLIWRFWGANRGSWGPAAGTVCGAGRQLACAPREEL